MRPTHSPSPRAGFLRDRRAVSAIEFALASPIILMLGLLTFDLGMGAYRQMQVQSAAQAGAEYVVVNGFDRTAIASAVASATPYSGISLSPDPVKFCGCPGASGLTTTSCGATCSNGRGAGTYVSVYTAATYSPIISYPGVPNSFSLAGQSTVRLQ
jgi:hypothetical protein